MFQGQYTVKVGAFYRIAFPSVYRKQLEETIIITYGFDQSLIMASESKWDNLYQKEIEGKSFLLPQVRDIRRFFLGGISTVDFDKQGRFLIPEYLREYSGIRIDNEAVFVWQKEYVELWSKETWLIRQKDILKNIAVIAEALSRSEAGNG